MAVVQRQRLEIQLAERPVNHPAEAQIIVVSPGTEKKLRDAMPIEIGVVIGVEEVRLDRSQASYIRFEFRLILRRNNHSVAKFFFSSAARLSTNGAPGKRRDNSSAAIR